MIMVEVGLRRFIGNTVQFGRAIVSPLDTATHYGQGSGWKCIDAPRREIVDSISPHLRTGKRVVEWVCILLLSLWVMFDCHAASGNGNQLPVEHALSFDDDILPLFRLRCVRCHGPARQEGKLDLSTARGVALGGISGDAIRVGNAQSSEIFRRIADNDMPPEAPLSRAERLQVEHWIETGAVGLPSEEAETSATTHWSFRSLQPTPVPHWPETSRGGTDIDRFLSAKLQTRGLQLGLEADRSTLIRRVSFGVTGLPPTPAQMAAFLTDSGEGAYSRMVERYLASQHYGERWGKYWLDVAGYADSEGYFDADSVRPLAYRYRDYVIRSINQDKPFDQFIREQIAGDELAKYDPSGNPAPQSRELLEATHFLRNAEDGTEASNGDPNMALRDRQAVLDATIEILGSVLFGITFQCAKCHDHKFEPVTQRDYYSLQAILAPAFNLRNWIVPSARYVYAATNEEHAEFMKAFKRGQVTEADRPGKIAAVRDVSPVPPEVFVLLGGDINSAGEKVGPMGPAMLTDNDFANRSDVGYSGSTGYRLAFATWLTRPNSRPAALLARLHVNRIWQHHFGTGLVASADNFGFSGDRPTHPELLEWLANQFVDSGWSSKAIHRLILNSAAYRQSSRLDTRAFHIDPENRLLWRMPVRRLDAEQIYDALNLISGQLDLQMGGPAVATVRDGDGEVVAMKVNGQGARRAVYIQQRRSLVPTIMQLFDAPSMVTNCVKRVESTIPLQSLAMLNSQFAMARAELFAKSVALEAGEANDQRVIRAFQITLARQPAGEELRASLQFIREQTRIYSDSSPVPQRRAWTDFCHSLLASNAFLYVD